MFAAMRDTLGDTHYQYLSVYVFQSQYIREKDEEKGRADVRITGEGLIFILSLLHLTLLPVLYELAALSPDVSFQHIILRCFQKNI